MEKLNGCQLPCLPEISAGDAEFGSQPVVIRIKRALASPWNKFIKRILKRINLFGASIGKKLGHSESNFLKQVIPGGNFQVGDMVRVRTLEEIKSTLDPFDELKGCAFLDGMEQYCGTERRVFKVMERFLDERDYKVKKTKGIILLEGVFCQGTPVFGRCDRSCLLFWREEWLVKL